MRTKFIALAAAAAVGFGFAGNANATSVADSQETANTLVAAAATPAASTATAGIIAAGVSSAIAPPPIAPPVPTFAPAPAPATIPSGGAGSGVIPGAGPQSSVNGITNTAYFNSRALSGVSAGGMQKKAGMWVQGGYTTIDNSDAGGEFDGDVTNLVAGFDYKVKDNAVVGVAISYENVDVNTTFNTGTFKGKGFTVSPYGGLVLKNGMVIDGMIGVSKINYDTTNTNRTISASFDGTRYMGALNLSKAIKTKKLTLTPKVGILQVREKQDAFTDSAGTASASNTINLGRASLGGTIAVSAGQFSPYVRAMAEYDYKKGAAADLGNGRTASNDKFGINAAIGVNAAISDKLSLNVEGTSSANMRDNLDIYGVTGRLRYNF